MTNWILGIKENDEAKKSPSFPICKTADTTGIAVRKMEIYRLTSKIHK